MMTPEKFNKIVTKLPKDKTLLKAEREKVELAIKDDAKKIIGNSSKVIQKLETEIKKSKELKKRYDETLKIDFENRDKLIKQINEFKKLNSAQAKIADKAFDIAKELGIQVTDISNFNQFDELWAATVNVYEKGTQRIKSLD